MICLRLPSFFLVRGTTNVGTCQSAHENETVGYSRVNLTLEKYLMKISLLTAAFCRKLPKFQLFKTLKRHSASKLLSNGCIL